MPRANQKRQPARAGIVRLLAAAAVLAVLRPALARADAVPQVPTRQERSIFLELLNAPDDPVVNLKYGHLAMAKGRLNRALEAFRRVLAVQPDNAEAADAIAKILAGLEARRAAKPKTDYYFVVGGQYESNAADYDPGLAAFDDTMAKAGFGVRDSRQLMGRRIETSAQFYKSLHNRWRTGDVLYVGLDSGPVITSGASSWRIAPLVRYARLGTRALFMSYGATLRYRRITKDAFKGFDALATYDDYQNSFAPYKGPRFNLHLRYQLNDLIEKGDTLSLVPSYYHVNGVGEAGTHRYDGLALAAAYSRPVYAHTVLTLGLTVEGRWYAGKGSTSVVSGSNRKDIKAKPEARLTFLDLLPRGGQLETRVNYIANFSSDFERRYRGYLVGAAARWNF